MSQSMWVGNNKFSLKAATALNRLDVKKLPDADPAEAKTWSRDNGPQGFDEIGLNVNNDDSFDQLKSPQIVTEVTTYSSADISKPMYIGLEGDYGQPVTWKVVDDPAAKAAVREVVEDYASVVRRKLSWETNPSSNPFVAGLLNILGGR